MYFPLLFSCIRISFIQYITHNLVSENCVLTLKSFHCTQLKEAKRVSVTRESPEFSGLNKSREIHHWRENQRRTEDYRRICGSYTTLNSRVRSFIINLGLCLHYSALLRPLCSDISHLHRSRDTETTDRENLQHLPIWVLPRRSDETGSPQDFRIWAVIEDENSIPTPTKPLTVICLDTKCVKWCKC